MKRKSNPKEIADLINAALENSVIKGSGSFGGKEWENLKGRLEELATKARLRSSDTDVPWAHVIALLNEGKDNPQKNDPFLRELANHINWGLVGKKPQELDYISLLGEFFPSVSSGDRVGLPSETIAALHSRKEKVKRR